MTRARFRGPSRSRWLAVGSACILAACPPAFAGSDGENPLLNPPPAVRLPSASEVPSPVQLPPARLRAQATREAPPANPSRVPPRSAAVAVTAPARLPAKMLPAAMLAPQAVSVNLDAVLRMTESQNAQIALARKRLEEAMAAECQHHCQLCQLLHHCCEGGEEGGGAGGSRYAAAARTWQRRVELSRTTFETLLDAGNTYFDLLTARRGEAIGVELKKYQENLLHRAENLAKSDRSAAVLVESLRSDLTGRDAAQLKLRQQGDAAAAKLAYLLNLPPETPVVPLDATLEPVDLVDVSPPVSELVARAQACGPAVRELAGLLATIEEGIASVGPCLAHLPKVARQLQTARFKADETRLALDDARGKLALGVIEAREAILSGRSQIATLAEQIRHAAEAYRLTDLRLREGATGASTTDVSQSIHGLEFAHFTHLAAVAAYDKAELRLLLLLGNCDDGGHPHGACSHP